MALAELLDVTLLVEHVVLHLVDLREFETGVQEALRGGGRSGGVRPMPTGAGAYLQVADPKVRHADALDDPLRAVQSAVRSPFGAGGWPTSSLRSSSVFQVSTTLLPRGVWIR